MVYQQDDLKPVPSVHIYHEAMRTFSNYLFSGYGLVLEGCIFPFFDVAQKVLNLGS